AVNNNGPYAWLPSGFFDDSGGDGLNNTFDDGLAYYPAAGNFQSPALATPEGLLVTTFQFLALQETTGTIVDILPSLGQQTTTQVFGDLPGEDVTGSLGSSGSVALVDWGVLATAAPGAACGVEPVDTVTVLLSVSELVLPINGVQALIQYDENVLSFVSIAPGDGASSPWNSATVVFEDLGGAIAYAVILLGSGTDVDAVVARIDFIYHPGATPHAADVQLIPEATPLLTKLTLASTGVTVIPDLQGPVVIARPGDWDTDGDIDLMDHAGFFSCLGGPDVTGLPPDCCRIDFDRDDDVDLVDFAELVTVFD
ncbi:MAG: hypothetical protein GY778_14910, partial [bacterium]|nr:hypothetical protein [bacterium]